MGERTVRIRKVKGSNPSVSTMKRSSCHWQGLLFILKEMGIRTRGLLETCRGKSAMPLPVADKGMALFPSRSFARLCECRLAKAKCGKVDSFQPEVACRARQVESLL